MSTTTYRIAGIQNVLTPALAIYLDYVDHNISATLRLLNGDANRWRPHIKTAKLAAVIEPLVTRGITNMKCATTRELIVACEAGARDVLVAYPCVGTRAERVREIAAMFPKVAISVLVDDPAQVSTWADSQVDVFLDVNPGMDRTGMEQDRTRDILALARAIRDQGTRFRGLHYYDGHLREPDLTERTRIAHRGFDRLLQLVNELRQQGTPVEEVITSGTPAFPCALAYEAFQKGEFVHRISPGTVVYNDLTSLAQLPADFDYFPAALVVSSVVSCPTRGIVTCDAGHKTVSADAGYPNCAVLGRPDLEPLHASEEHLPLHAASEHSLTIGKTLYLLPRHVCPTVNNFDHALLISGGEIVDVAAVSARGREAPLRTPLYEKSRVGAT
ncbi:MAG TPA: D-TA family PLP-dependent enzyme [Terriglobales bacterium]|nr:D-TA family PLP-dependent enzyme [Terriglobales bacterium]